MMFSRKKKQQQLEQQLQEARGKRCEAEASLRELLAEVRPLEMKAGEVIARGVENGFGHAMEVAYASLKKRNP